MTMEGVIPMLEQKSEKQVEGKPWKVIGRCATYEEASLQKKNFLAENPDTPVKIKFSRSQKIFLVKTRKV